MTAGVLWFVLRFTIFGRGLHAVGDAPVASRLAGLRVDWLRACAYVGCGALAGAAGVLVAARVGLISPSIGYGLEFFAIAVVALGAGGLPAGRVSVGQTAIGVLILMMIFNYMTIRGVPGTWQTTATGLLLLAAMVGGRLLQRNSGGDMALGEAFRDDFANMSRTGAALARGSMAAATLLLALIFALINPNFFTVAESLCAGGAERGACDHLGRRDDRHRVAGGRHLAGLGAGSRRGGGGARRQPWRAGAAGAASRPRHLRRRLCASTG